MIYLYNGEFNSFLTCIYNHYYLEKATGIYNSKVYQQQLFEHMLYVEEDNDKAKKVYNAIVEKLSKEVYKEIFTAFLSGEYYKDCYLLKYLQLAFKYGEDISNLHGIEDVYNVQKLSKNVSREKHRFLGILRFSDMTNCLYAKLEPDNDILILLGDHFSDRLKNERFIIHDVKRNKAIIGNYGEWIITDFIFKEKLVYSKEELFMQNLWTEYFESIGIENRKNNKLQRSFVPLKYRKNIIEFNNINKKQ
jgi:probable DNA metabolism protein